MNEAAELAQHLKDRGTDAMIVIDGDGTSTVEKLLAAGWTYQGTESAYGKRIRYLRAPVATS